MSAPERPPSPTPPAARSTPATARPGAAPAPVAPWLLAPRPLPLLLTLGLTALGLGAAAFAALAVVAARLPPSHSGALIPGQAQLGVVLALVLLPGVGALLLQPPGSAPLPLRARIGAQALLWLAGVLAGAARPVWLPAGQPVGQTELLLAAGLPAVLIGFGQLATLWASWAGRARAVEHEPSGRAAPGAGPPRG